MQCGLEDQAGRHSLPLVWACVAYVCSALLGLAECILVLLSLGAALLGKVGECRCLLECRNNKRRVYEKTNGCFFMGVDAGVAAGMRGAGANALRICGYVGSDAPGQWD